MQNLKKHTATLSAVPAHIADFGTFRLFGGPASLHYPEPAGGEGAPASGEPQLTRAQWVAQEAVEQAKKSVEQLARDNAGLQYDLNVARSRFDGSTQVAISKEDHAAFTAYREAYPTPKDALDAKKKLGELEDKDTLRSYDEKRTALLANYPDLPDSYKNLIPTAEEALKRPGGQEIVRDLAFLEAEVDRYAKSYGVTPVDPALKDVGASPASVASGSKPTKGDDGAQAVAAYRQSRLPQNPQKE